MTAGLIESHVIEFGRSVSWFWFVFFFFFKTELKRGDSVASVQCICRDLNRIFIILIFIAYGCCNIIFQRYMSFLQSLFLSSAVSLIVTRLNKLIAFLELRLKVMSFTCSVLTTYIFISELFNSRSWLYREADKKKKKDKKISS